MQKYLRQCGYVLLILLILGGILFFKYGVEPVETPPPALKSRSLQETPDIEPIRDAKPSKTDIQKKQKEKIALKKKPIEKPAEPQKTYPKYIEDIKSQVYEKQIESVDQIALLDEIVQTGNKDVRQFWGDGWTSVDDWKKEENGFTLEKKADGSLVFNPGPATARKYTFFQTPKNYKYDAEHKEFVNEVDYYGKTIYNVVKFINDDVMAMMTISGEKVDLNLYQKNANQMTTLQADKNIPADLGASGLTR